LRRHKVFMGRCTSGRVFCESVDFEGPLALHNPLLEKVWPYSRWSDPGLVWYHDSNQQTVVRSSFANMLGTLLWIIVAFTVLGLTVASRNSSSSKLLFCQTIAAWCSLVQLTIDVAIQDTHGSWSGIVIATNLVMLIAIVNVTLKLILARARYRFARVNSLAKILSFQWLLVFSFNLGLAAFTLLQCRLGMASSTMVYDMQGGAQSDSATSVHTHEHRSACSFPPHVALFLLNLAAYSYVYAFPMGTMGLADIHPEFPFIRMGLRFNILRSLDGEIPWRNNHRFVWDIR
jgi:hypothetical protein